MKKSYTIKAKVWLYPGQVAWHFVSVPSDVTKDIDYYFAHVRRGWGSLPVTVKVGNTSWNTSIFPDKKTATFLLPIKASVRQREAIKENDEIAISLTIEA